MQDWLIGSKARSHDIVAEALASFIVAIPCPW
jgi:hypothetical protein